MIFGSLLFACLVGKNIEKLKEKYSNPNKAYYFKHIKIVAVYVIIFETVFLSLTIISLVCNCLYNFDNLFSAENIRAMLLVVLFSMLPFAINSLLGIFLTRKNKKTMKINKNENVEQKEKNDPQDRQ